VRRFNAGIALYGLIVLVVLVPKAVVPDAAIYRTGLPELTLLRFGAMSKLLFLGLAALFAYRTASSFEADNPVRRAWRLLAVGLVGYLLAQGYLAFFHLVLGTSSPFPSPADAVFMAANPFLLAAFWVFIRAYREAGFPVGTAREHALLALAAAIAFSAIGVFLLRPILDAPAPPLERFLNIAYPAFDFLILVPILILLRITFAFRGGQVWTVWAALLAGFVFLCAGDVLYAYFATMAQKHLESIVDAMFILAYVFIAQGTVQQYELVKS